MIRIMLTSICLLGAMPALAQSPPKQPTADTPAQTGCPPNASTVTPPGASGETTGQAGNALGDKSLGDNKPLGDKLAQSGGVLCPPSGVDPDMRAPTPDVGNTPVIKPPGTPGGDQSVQPK